MFSKRCTVLISVFFLLAPIFTFAQIAWFHPISSPGPSDNAEQHVVHNDFVYTCGYFEQSVIIGDILLTSRGESDIFIYKTRTDGTVVWAKSLGGPSYDGDVGLGVDADGNVYLAGGFVGKLFLDNSPVLSANSGNPYWNSFISKFDENGNLIWIKGILGESQYSENRIWGKISVSSNSFAIAATFSGSISLDGLSIPGSTFNSNLLIAKFDLDGNLIWTKLPPGARDCRKIYLDDAGLCYLTGPFNATIQFDNYSLSGNPNYSDVYLAKLDDAGQTLWLAGGIKTSSRIDNNWSTSFTVDPIGNIYLIGLFKGNVAFGPVTLHGNTDPEYSITDTFLVKYNSTGEVQYAVIFGDAFNAFSTDIVYSPVGLFILGMSPGSGQFFYSLVDDNNPGASAPVYVDGYGIPWHLSVVDETTFYISGFAGRVMGRTSNGDWDGVLMKVAPCIAQAPADVSQIKGVSLLCLKDEVTYSVDPVEYGIRYVWVIPSLFSPGGEIRTASNEITLKVSSSGSGNVSVYAVNECDQMTNTSTLAVRVEELLEKPVIVKQPCDRELTFLKGENIEWFRNEELVEGNHTTSIVIADSGVYKVRIYNSCSTQESEAVSAYPPIEEPFFPNVMTPNGDKKNDWFYIDKTLRQSELKIYNRWGGIVYESNAYDNSWQGENVSSGVYFYYLRNPCHPEPYKGNIQVIK